jgi:hypothetical protein
MMYRRASLALFSLSKSRPTGRPVSSPFLRRHGAAVRTFKVSCKAASPVALVVDTETTGLQDPHPVQVAMILVDTADWKRRAQCCFLVQLPPNDQVSIHPKAEEVKISLD